MARPALGIALFPDLGFLRAARAALESGRIEVLELSPDLAWQDGRTPDVARRDALRELGARSGARLVAHGVEAALGEPTGDGALEAEAEARLRADQATFAFTRWSEHLAFASGGGLLAALPLPLPDTPAAIATAAGRLRRLSEVVGVPVAFEPVACPFRLCAPAREAELVNEVAAAADCDVVLDLHNAWAGERNGGLSLDGWLDALDLSRVVELHLAGGSPSDPAWLASGRSLWLDSHDAPVPEPVWRALERLLPRCPRLDAVVLERVPDALGPDAVPAWEAELARARELLCSPT